MTNIEIKVKSIFDQLSNAERSAAQYFLNNANSIFDKPIAVLAKESQTIDKVDHFLTLTGLRVLYERNQP